MDFTCQEISASQPGKVAAVARNELKKATDLIEEKKFEKAAALLKKTLKKYPRHIAARRCLAGAYYRSGQAESAILELKKIIALDPNNAENYFNLGFIYHSQGENDPAILNYERALALDPGNLKYKKQLGETLFGTADSLYATRGNRLDNQEKIIGYLEKLIRLQSGHVNGHELLGRVYEDSGDVLTAQGNGKEAKTNYEKARDEYLKTVILDPRHKASLFLARICLALERNDLALRYVKAYLRFNDKEFTILIGILTKLVSKEPKNLELRKLLAIAYHRSSQNELAIREYKQIMVLEPNRAENYNNLGVLYRARGLQEEAAQCFERAVELEPSRLEYKKDLAGIYFSMAIIQYATFDRARRSWSRMIDYLNRSIRHEPNNAEAYLLLGKIHEEIGDFWKKRNNNIKAEEYYKKAQKAYLEMKRIEAESKIE